MKARCAIVLLGMLASANLCADELFEHPQTAAQLLQGPLAQPAAELRAAQVLRGKFVYRKFLQEIPQPLLSQGEFVFVKGQGIDWHTHAPFDSDFVLTATGMKQIDAGKTTLQVNASEQPAVRIVARIFLSLLSLDVGALQDSFSLFGLQQGKHWQVGLRPTAPAIAAVFRDAIVNGETQVQGLLLHDANGDRTEISFVETQYAAIPSAQDLQPFSK